MPPRSRHDGPWPSRARSRAEVKAGRPDLGDVVRWSDQQDQPLDTDTLQHLTRARLRLEPALLQPGEHRGDEAGGIASGRAAFVARDAQELGEVRMKRLRVESVAVPSR